MINKVPKKVIEAITDICDDVEAMLGCDNGDEDGFDELNKKRIEIIRKYLRDHDK